MPQMEVVSCGQAGVNAQLVLRQRFDDFQEILTPTGHELLPDLIEGLFYIHAQSLAGGVGQMRSMWQDVFGNELAAFARPEYLTT